MYNDFQKSCSELCDAVTVNGKFASGRDIIVIEIGLAGWGDHDSLYGAGVRAGDKLGVYARHFSVVEVDSTFYAIHSPEQCGKWAEQTPEHFRFIVKAYKGLTGHERRPSNQAAEREMEELESCLQDFIRSIEPFVDSGKLQAVLFQYPPWFDCTKNNVNRLRLTKQWLGSVPAALEFRHSSWFSEQYASRTLQFMREEGWIHSVCDEPQVEPYSVPTVLQGTHNGATIVRMHGRNREGWINKGNENWREVRYLYRYSREELEQWAEHLVVLEQQSERVCVVFNNNSGGDAAGNAKMLMELLGKPVLPLAPEQLELF